ncbi:hypothetical protein BVRB_5g109950 [Beta vulgaris subsp. vulgaris]|nr:hypothetical protein BVRB_5g109950 [Beta vulgaris subsp. vulgaris]
MQKDQRPKSLGKISRILTNSVNLIIDFMSLKMRLNSPS